MRQIILRKRARLGLERIIEHTEKEWGNSQALKLAYVFKKAFENIAQSPRLGRAINRPNMYALTLFELPFVVIYKVDTSCIRIVKIIHTKRNR